DPLGVLRVFTGLLPGSTEQLDAAIRPSPRLVGVVDGNRRARVSSHVTRVPRVRFSKPYELERWDPGDVGLIYISAATGRDLGDVALAGGIHEPASMTVEWRKRYLCS